MPQKQEPYKPNSITQMLLYLQAEMAEGLSLKRKMCQSIHRLVGCASDMAELLERVAPDLPPDLYERAIEVLKFYRKTVGHQS